MPANTGTKFGGGGKARAGREGKGVWGKGIPAPPERNFQKSASGFSLKKVRILFKTDSQCISENRQSGGFLVE